MTDLSTSAYYAYIALYVIFFILYDPIIIGLTAFAIQRDHNRHFTAISRAAGGMTLMGLGAWMLVR